MENLEKIEFKELIKIANDLAQRAGKAYHKGNKEEAEMLLKECDTIKGEQRRRKIEWRKERDLELLKKAIPKEDLEDGAWYDCEDEAKTVARFGGKAKWDKERNMFLAPGQQQFGMDGWLDHFEDAIKTGYAGFIPMWKVEE